MKFVALIDYANKEKLMEIRPTHRAYLTELKKAGKLVVAGAFADLNGGLLVYEVENAEEAEKLIKADPFYAGGVFAQWTIRQWNPVISNRELLPEAPPA